MVTVTLFGRAVPAIAFLYTLELLLAELVFCMNYDKRDHFAVRVCLFPAVVILASPFLNFYAAGIGFVRFFSLLLIIALTAIVMLLCFRGDRFSIIISAIGGVAVQHIANKLFILVTLIPGLPPMHSGGSAESLALEFVIFLVVLWVSALIFLRQSPRVAASYRLGLLSAAIIMICIGVNRIASDFDLVTVEAKLAASVYAIVACVMALMIQVYISRWQQQRTDHLVVQKLLEDSEKQYEQWKTSTKEMNIRFHDIKHMLSRIERLAGEQNISIPDIGLLKSSIEELRPSIRTGNDVLDVLLRNMTELCRKERIRLQCVAYDDSLGHFDGLSLYFLIANAIDNAMDGAKTVEDPEKRLIDLSVRRFGDSVKINIWNFFSGSVSLDEEGLPISKGGAEHGYGVRSMKLIVDRFGGAMSAAADGEIFNLDIILPIVVE